MSKTTCCALKWLTAARASPPKICLTSSSRSSTGPWRRAGLPREPAWGLRSPKAYAKRTAAPSTCAAPGWGSGPPCPWLYLSPSARFDGLKSALAPRDALRCAPVRQVYIKKRHGHIGSCRSPAPCTKSLTRASFLHASLASTASDAPKTHRPDWLTSRPIDCTQLATMRAYWRVDKCGESLTRLGNKY